MKLCKMILIVGFILSLQACEETDESFETSAQIQIDIPLTAWYLNSDPQLKTNSGEHYQFNGSAAFCLATKEGLGKCPGSVSGVVAGSGAELTFEALAGEQEINTLTLEWGYSGNLITGYEMQAPIQLLPAGEHLNKVRFSIGVDELISPVVSKMDHSPGTYIVIGLSGDSNFDASIEARLTVPVTVESLVVSPRFTL